MSVSSWIDRLRSTGPGAGAVQIVQRTIRSILPAALRRAHQFEGSHAYWEGRYRSGGSSGPGSYGELATFKAETLNAFIASEGIRSVIEFGCGDGHQLSLARYPRYLGIDVSLSAIARCKNLFADDRSKEFRTAQEYAGIKADAALSLDVIYHLIENPIFEQYMATIFDSSDRWVIIYASNFDGSDEYGAEHVRHRRFTDWIDANRPDWYCARVVKNRFPFTGDFKTSSHADFYFFTKR